MEYSGCSIDVHSEALRQRHQSGPANIWDEYETAAARNSGSDLDDHRTAVLCGKPTRSSDRAMLAHSGPMAARADGFGSGNLTGDVDKYRSRRAWFPHRLNFIYLGRSSFIVVLRNRSRIALPKSGPAGTRQNGEQFCIIQNNIVPMLNGVVPDALISRSMIWRGRSLPWTCCAISAGDGA